MIVVDGWTLIDHDPPTGRMTWVIEHDGQTTFRTDYPVDATIKANQRAYNDSLNQRWAEGQRVASIPLNIFYDQIQEAQAQGDSRYVSKWLNDPDHRAFRTFEGKV